MSFLSSLQWRCPECLFFNTAAESCEYCSAKQPSEAQPLSATDPSKLVKRLLGTRHDIPAEDQGAAKHLTDTVKQILELCSRIKPEEQGNSRPDQVAISRTRVSMVLSSAWNNAMPDFLRLIELVFTLVRDNPLGMLDLRVFELRIEHCLMSVPELLTVCDLGRQFLHELAGYEELKELQVSLGFELRQDAANIQFPPGIVLPLEFFPPNMFDRLTHLEVFEFTLPQNEIKMPFLAEVPSALYDFLSRSRTLRSVNLHRYMFDIQRVFECVLSNPFLEETRFHTVLSGTIEERHYRPFVTKETMERCFKRFPVTRYAPSFINRLDGVLHTAIPNGLRAANFGDLKHYPLVLQKQTLMEELLLNELSTETDDVKHLQELLARNRYYTRKWRLGFGGEGPLVPEVMSAGEVESFARVAADLIFEFVSIQARRVQSENSVRVVLEALLPEDVLREVVGFTFPAEKEITARPELFEVSLRPELVGRSLTLRALFPVEGSQWGDAEARLQTVMQERLTEFYVGGSKEEPNPTMLFIGPHKSCCCVFEYSCKDV